MSGGSVAYDVAVYLQTMGVGVMAASDGWSINVAQDGDTPDTTITLQDEGGGEPDTDELDIQVFNVHIRIRSDKLSTGYNEAYAKHSEIRDLLIHQAPFVTDNMQFLGVRMVGNIANLGRDGNDRHILLATYELQRQTLASAS